MILFPIKIFKKFKVFFSNLSKSIKNFSQINIQLLHSRSCCSYSDMFNYELKTMLFKLISLVEVSKKQF